jgi:hypothetical protein
MARVKAKSPENFPALSKALNTPPVRTGPVGAGAGGYASYAEVASGRASAIGSSISPYLSMVVDPMTKEKGVRYPDETIVPTGMVHLASSTTFTIPEDYPTPGLKGSIWTALRWKCDVDNVSTTANTAPILGPQGIGDTIAYTDYGNPQKTWSDLSSVDRTLAAGIRVRVVALPTATYLPSGTLYFLQIQASDSFSDFSTEQGCIQAVTAGKGFSMTVNELSKSDGVTLPYLPQGPMSFVFSDTNAEAPVTAGAPGSGLASTVVSANGSIAIFGFGLQPGMTVRLDYAHHIEYIPRVQAAGLVMTKVEPPSAPARDAISRGAQLVQQSLAGATSLGKVSGVVTGGGISALSTLARAAVGMIPGASQGLAVAKAAAEGLGAPSWLKSAIGFFA